MVAVAVLQINTNKPQHLVVVQQEMLFLIQEPLSSLLLVLLEVTVVQELMEHQTLATLEQVKLLLHQQTLYLELYPLAVLVVEGQVVLQIHQMVRLAVQVEQLTVVKVAIAAVIMEELAQELLVVQQMELVAVVAVVAVVTHILTLLLLALLDFVVKLQCILSK
jgi:hypothetical protein